MEKKYTLYTIPVFQQGTNCYILACNATKQATIIDPGSDANLIIAKVETEHLQVTSVINTHGHFDHIGANQEIKTHFGVPLLIHEADEPMLSRNSLNLAIIVSGKTTPSKADRLLHDGDTIQVGELKLTVIHTPGHTEGGICLLCEDILFSGDTLFQLSIGRSDFPGGDFDTLIDSIQTKLIPLSDELLVYPGHGPATNLGYEKKFNPYIRQN